MYMTENLGDGGASVAPAYYAPLDKPLINLIAAVGKRGQLGLNGRLPWIDREDLSWFRQTTMNGIILVGYNTAQTLPALPGRDVVVDDLNTHPVHIAANLAGLGKVIWIAGGAKTYARWMPYIRRSFITHVDYDGPADAWMPSISGAHDA